jgi:CubicO group peptidase (beta-lactamase class C family)
MRPVLSAAFLSLALAATALPAGAAPPPPVAVSEAASALISPAEQEAIDQAVAEVLRRTEVPSASIAVVRDGRIAYRKAYGLKRLEPREPADLSARYGIGSVSKQFTAAVILMLAEEGRLSLEDPVGKYVPGLTAGDRITIRQVLSHTSGYRDYWPQDYVMAEMTRPAGPQHILDGWARIPLDFEPGAQWQYSNTGYTVAGLIVEKVAGKPLMQVIRERIYAPLRLTGADETDTRPLGPQDARGYLRYGLGPLHPAPKEGAGWLWAMGGLAMSPRDLALWDISLIDRSLLKPASYEKMFAEVKLNDGRGAGYGLGVRTGLDHGRRLLSHGGAISGFLTENRVYPDDRAAIVVMVNADFGDAQGAIADRIADVLFPAGDEVRTARAVFDELAAGRIDRSRFTPNANAYFTDQAVREIAESLKPLGAPRSFTLVGKRLRGGMTQEVYSLAYPNRRLRIVLRAYPDGRIEQFLIQPSD